MITKGWISREAANDAVASGPPFSRDAMAPTFESFVLIFCMVLLASLWAALEPHLISYEAAHMLFKIIKDYVLMRQRGHQKGAPQNFNVLFFGPFLGVFLGPLTSNIHPCDNHHRSFKKTHFELLANLRRIIDVTTVTLSAAFCKRFSN